jgi:hypothetical protein
MNWIVGIVLFALSMAGCFSQTTEDPRDVQQHTADYLLKGLPTMEVFRGVHPGGDDIKEFSHGAIDREHVLTELEVVLRRYHIPLAPGTPTIKDSVGTIWVLSRTEVGPGNNASFTLHIQVCEAATLKRNPALKVSVVLWDDEQEIDSLQVDSKSRFLEGIRELGQRLALAYLSANK